MISSLFHAREDAGVESLIMLGTWRRKNTNLGRDTLYTATKIAANNRVQRTLHKVSGPLTRDVVHRRLKTELKENDHGYK